MRDAEVLRAPLVLKCCLSKYFFVLYAKFQLPAIFLSLIKAILNCRSDCILS